jgi:hypothetical protein
MAAHEGAVWVGGGGVLISSEIINPKRMGALRQYSTAVHSYQPDSVRGRRRGRRSHHFRPNRTGVQRGRSADSY